MRTGDVRRVCLVLVHNRVLGTVPSDDPLPVALGWRLEQGSASARAMAALCAGVLDGPGGAAGRWRPSAELEALLSEYGSVRRDRPALSRGRGRGAPQRARAASTIH